MDAKEFEAHMLKLLPSADPVAMRCWVMYAEELDRNGTHPAEDFFDEVFVELDLIKKHDGDEIGRQLFDAGRAFTLNPFEMRGAATYLKEGMSIAEICQKSIDGLCDGTAQECEESDRALEAFLKDRALRNILPEQAAPNTLLGLMRSGVSFYNVILRSANANDPDFDYSTASKCVNNKIHEMSQAMLERRDLSEWADVLTATVAQLSPGRHEMTFVLRDIAEQRVADFAEVMTGYEAQERAQAREQESSQPSSPEMHMPY